METIKAIINDGYSILNWTQNKAPLAGKKWNEKTYAELKATHNFTCKNWGIKLGKHENNRRLLCFDFDIYGSTHKDTPCPVAEKEFEYYFEMAGEETADGLFYGSTVGNAGLLVDYTDNEELCACIDMLNSLGEGQSKIGEMEVFWGNLNCILLPPSATFCKRADKVVQARKYINNNWVCVLDNSTIDECWKVKWMCEHLKTIIQKFQKPPKPYLLTPPNSRTGSPTTSGNTPPSPTTSGIVKKDKYVELLMNFMGNPKNDNGIGHKVVRPNFIKICGALKSNGYDPQVWRDWIGLDRKNGDGMKTWDSLSIERKTPMECIRSVAREVAPEAYTRWKREFHIFLPYETLMKGENDIAKFLEYHLSPYLRCFKKIWWLYDERTCLWTKTDAPTSYIISTLQQLIDDATADLGAVKASKSDEKEKDELQKKIDNYNAYRRKCCGSSVYNALQQFLKTGLACDKEWCERFDFNPYQIPYKNGLFCLKTNTFREGLLASDYLTTTLAFNYQQPNEEDVAWVREELKKICNYKEEHLERYLSQFGYMLCGDPSRIQEFYNFKGEKACNGKSSVLDALTHIIPTLCKKLDSNVFEKSAKSSLHKTIATLYGVRIVWLNEIDASAIQDEGTIKTLRDGMTISFNEMYGVSMSMKLSCKTVFVGNNGMKVKGDAGVMRSMAMNQFNSEFSEDATENDYVNCVFVRDTEFMKKLIEKKHSFLGLLYQYSKKFWEEGKLKSMPKEWLNEKEEVRDNLAKFDKWFDMNYEWAEGRDDWTAWIDDIETQTKTDKIKCDDIKTELKRMKLWNKPIEYKSQERSHKKKGCFHNLRLREEQEENTITSEDC